MKTLVVAPHPDDELFGCGGTLLKRKAAGHELIWIIVTELDGSDVVNTENADARTDEINKIVEQVGFNSIYKLGFPTAQLDQVPFRILVKAVSDIIAAVQPDEIFAPHFSDIHSDHRLTFDAVASSMKWFRNSSVMRVLCYETLSETDFGVIPSYQFTPNYFENIEMYLEAKIQLLATYESELSNFPFPRSSEAVKALAHVRGASSGYKAAEAFQLIRERRD